MIGHFHPLALTPYPRTSIHYTLIFRTNDTQSAHVSMGTYNDVGRDQHHAQVNIFIQSHAHVQHHSHGFEGDLPGGQTSVRSYTMTSPAPRSK
jgi:hypothetical protein